MSITFHANRIQGLFCSGCEPQMTQEVPANEQSVYIFCDPKTQCCPRPMAPIKSLWSDISSYAGFSLAAAVAGSGAGINPVAAKEMQEAWQLIRKAEAKKGELTEETKVSLDIVGFCLEASKKYRGLAVLAQHHKNPSLLVFAARRQAAAIGMALEYNWENVDPRHDPVVAEAEAFVLAVPGRASAIQTTNVAPEEAARSRLAKAAILHAGLDTLLQLDEKLPETWKIKGAKIDGLADSIAREFTSAEGLLVDTTEHQLLAKVRFSAMVWFETMAGVYRGRRNHSKAAECVDMAIYFSNMASETYDLLISKSSGLEKARYLISRAQVIYWKANTLEDWHGKRVKRNAELDVTIARRDAKSNIDEALRLVKAVEDTDTSNLLRQALVLQHVMARRGAKTEDSPSEELKGLFGEERNGEMLREADMGNTYDRELVADVLDMEIEEVVERLLTNDPEFKDLLRGHGLNESEIGSLTESARRNLGEPGIKEWRRRTRALK